MRLRAIRLLAVILVTIAALEPGSLTAQDRTLFVEQFHADINVLRSGEMTVRETIRFRFDGAWNGVFRTIPVRYDAPGNFGYDLDVDLNSATLDDGTELRVESSRSGGSLKWKIWVPDARDVTRTVTIQYRVANGLRYFEEHDELYWNVTGHEWEVELGPATATVQLPADATGIRSTSFVGPWGSDAEGGEAEVAGAQLRFDSVDPLGFRNGMTVVVGWDRGLVERPTRLEKIVGFLGANLVIVLPLFSWWGIHRLWLARGKDPESRPIMPQYEPPGGIGPAEAGTLVDHTPNLHDIISSIVDLAVRGHLRIDEVDPEGLIDRFLGKDEYAFVRLDPPADDALRPYEARILDGVFDGGATRVTTSDLENNFYRKISGIQTAILDGLVSQGYYLRRPDKVVGVWAVVGVMASVIMGTLLLIAAATVGVSPAAAIIGGFGFGVPVLIYAFIMPARTVRGARATEHVRGMEEFLARVDKDRFRRMIKTPEQFEAMLPFAMALKVDEKWARAFEDIFSEPPDWYRGRYGSDGFRSGHLIDSLSSWSSRTGSAMQTAPRSSSSGSSGFGGGGGGGGFSGGGFGGGGGGGF